MAIRVIDGHSMLDDVVDKAKKETLTSICLLLVEASCEIFVCKSDPHKLLDVVLVFPKCQAGLVFKLHEVVVQSRGHSETSLLHEVDVVPQLRSFL